MNELYFHVKMHVRSDASAFIKNILDMSTGRLEVTWCIWGISRVCELTCCLDSCVCEGERASKRERTWECVWGWSGALQGEWKGQDKLSWSAHEQSHVQLMTLKCVLSFVNYNFIHYYQCLSVDSNICHYYLMRCELIPDMIIIIYSDHGYIFICKFS